MMIKEKEKEEEDVTEAAETFYTLSFVSNRDILVSRVKINMNAAWYG